MSMSLIGERTRPACWRGRPRHRELSEMLADLRAFHVQIISARATKCAREGACAPQTRCYDMRREFGILLQSKFNGF